MMKKIETERQRWMLQAVPGNREKMLSRTCTLKSVRNQGKFDAEQNQ